MKNTGKKIVSGTKGGYPVYRTVWEHEGKYFMKDGKELIEVFKNENEFKFKHQM